MTQREEAGAAGRAPEWDRTVYNDTWQHDYLSGDKAREIDFWLGIR